MKIEQLQLQEHVQGNVAHAFDSHAPHSAAVQVVQQEEQALVSSEQTIKVPVQAIEWLQFLNEHFSQTNLLFLVKDVLENISVMQSETHDTSVQVLLKEVADLLSSVIIDQQRAVSPIIIRSIMQLCACADDLKLKLLQLVSLTQANGHETALPTAVEKLINYLNGVQFLNQKTVSDSTQYPASLYIPLALNSPLGYGRKAELVVRPRFDGNQQLKEDEYSFDMMIETDSLGRLGFHVDVVHSSVSCRLSVETWPVKEIVQDNIGDLIVRLRSKRVHVSSVHCQIAPAVPDYVSSCMPHVEVDV